MGRRDPAAAFLRALPPEIAPGVMEAIERVVSAVIAPWPASHLVALALEQGPRSRQELARVVPVPWASVQRAITRLRKAGHIAGRDAAIGLTPAGRAALAALREDAARVYLEAARERVTP